MSEQRTSTDITVSIVNWNTKEELAGCLDSVLRQQGVGFDVVVVDNGSSDGSAEMVKTRYPQAVLIATSDNKGFAGGQNEAFAFSRGRYILLLNPDARMIGDDVLANIIKFGDSESKVGIFGTRILNTDGSLQFSARRFPTLGAGIFRNSILGRLFPRNRYVKEYLMTDWDHDAMRDVDWVSGAAMVLRRAALDDIGPLDEGFFMYCEDVDICYRAHEKGWRVCYYPGATVTHKIAASSDLAQVRMIYQFHKSMLRFFNKHYARTWPVHKRLFVLLGLTFRCTAFIAINVVKRALRMG